MSRQLGRGRYSWGTYPVPRHEGGSSDPQTFEIFTLPENVEAGDSSVVAEVTGYELSSAPGYLEVQWVSGVATDAVGGQFIFVVTVIADDTYVLANGGGHTVLDVASTGNVSGLGIAPIPEELLGATVTIRMTCQFSGHLEGPGTVIGRDSLVGGALTMKIAQYPAAVMSGSFGELIIPP